MKTRARAFPARMNSTKPNNPAADKAAITSQLTIGHHRRGLLETFRIKRGQWDHTIACGVLEKICGSICEN